MANLGDNIDENFSRNIKSALTTGKVGVAYCHPQNFKYGKAFKNKSAESRTNRVTDQILKLQVLLIHDPHNSHTHLLKFFRKCFTLD